MVYQRDMWSTRDRKLRSDDRLTPCLWKTIVALLPKHCRSTQHIVGLLKGYCRSTQETLSLYSNSIVALLKKHCRSPQIVLSLYSRNSAFCADSLGASRS